jgi:NCS2 family nucleobase:cation symporter-2/xanthine permease
MSNTKTTTGVHPVDEKLPVGKAAILGLQHVLAMYVGAMLAPIILAAGLGMDNSDLTILISADLFCCGIATFIQSFGITRFIGIKMPLIIGVAAQTAAALIVVGNQYGIPAIFGSIIGAGIFMIVAAPFYVKILRFFPAVVTGSITTIIGVTLIPIGMGMVMGNEGEPYFGAPRNVLIAFVTIAAIVIVNKFAKGFLRAIAVLIGLATGAVLSGFLGMMDTAPIAAAPLFQLIEPFHFGLPVFTASGIISISMIALVNMVESTGLIYATSDVVGKEVTPKDIAKAIRAEGVASILGGIMNTFLYTTFTQNIGLLSLTRVISRWVTVAAGIILVLLGLVPKFAEFITMIPRPVIGGAMVCMFGMVAITGIGMLNKAGLHKRNNLIVAGFSIGIGLGVSVHPIMAQMPTLVNAFFSSGIVTGSITAVILNLVLNHGKNTESEQEIGIGDEQEIENGDEKNSVTQ